MIAFTTTGAAKYRALLKCISPKIIVIEEAAEVLEAHIIATLNQDCQHVILIGDHQQLRPKPTVYRLAEVFNLKISLFERMINNGLPCHTLRWQHRMRPEISVLMKEHFYHGLEDHKSVTDYSSIKGLTKNVLFLNHEQNEARQHDSMSKSNRHEAEFLVGLCYYLIQQGYQPSQVTILTTYMGQLSIFKQLMPRAKFSGVRVKVVDNFQGEESDIILLSLVRSNEEESIGFLKDDNRICVALSRARMGFYCIGNIRLLAKKSSLWKKIMTTLTRKNQMCGSLTLECQNHPGTRAKVACRKDFAEKTPEGGCLARCNAELQCKHTCGERCHPWDPKHEKYKCQTSVRKRFAQCQHTAQVKCHESMTAICRKPCTKKMMPCKHNCPAKCGEKCPAVCMRKCSKKMSCSHFCRRKCGVSCMTRVQCKEKVEVKQPKCGHSYFMECKDNPKWRSAADYPPCDVCSKMESR